MHACVQSVTSELVDYHNKYSMLSSFRTVPVLGQIVFKAYFRREK